MPDKLEIENWFKALQDSICSGLEKLDGQSKFKEDQWQRKEGGGGRTRIIENGHILEKGGVNFSAVHGSVPPQMYKILEVENLDESLTFLATGVSIVLHPHSPMSPIIHMNVRYFEMSNGLYWFGGGIDLTPHYVMPDLAKGFHLQLKQVCDEHDSAYYPKFKKWADDYFYIKHRKETRGIGGIFFDRLQAVEGKSKQQIWRFVQAVGSAFLPLYEAQILATKDLEYTNGQKKWQSLRRGRYVEFNLVLDRGTKFGLETNGRTESILMSLPSTASWAYCHETENGSSEAATLNYLRKGIDWVQHQK